MQWFIAKLVYRIVCGNGNHQPQFDEQLRLVGAASKTTALQRATAMGLAEQDTFYNDKQQLVQWQFVAVCELHSFNSRLHGAALASYITEVNDASAYISFTQHKAACLQARLASALPATV